MRMIFGLLGLLLVLAVLAIVAKKQVHSDTALPAVSPATSAGASPLSNRAQSQQQQAMEAAPQSRALADEK